MSGAFKVGDVVVCVEAVTKGRLGKIGKVTFVHGPVNCATCDGPCAGLDVSCFANARDGYGYCEHCFRHLPKADDQFTAKMRACKPIHEDLPA